MSYENVLLDEIEAGIWVLTVNRPHALNALNSATIADIGAALQAVAANAAARVLIVTGAGEKAFVAGADIKEMSAFSGVQGQDFSRRTMAVFRSLETLSIPTIAMVNGYALGGGNELAMSCDWIIAGDNAVFGQPEVGLGVTPGFGGTQRLTRLVGRARALELILTARNVKAAEALTLGLANHVYPAAELREQVLKQARMIASRGPLAVKLGKEAVQRGQDLDLDNACQFEAQVFGLCFSTADQKEGMAAFIGKRPAAFRGE
ncbi:enoyl-CoA hydratase-related protein [Plasticicumulans acidivorans]|uniref:Enoyl-CoA hydratase n=1 Tax=Plasticicumulans acidivorans TaxID=886464 RepID=A0A317MTG1_9GAMM|nr:enoyl-CoA hydratase-related protein [Plasticicumulans acidivorans]PWV60191.1 enoyl-CoA hydratase [Plasticicumulans acidivorans]